MNRVGFKENRLGLDDRQYHSRAVQFTQDSRPGAFSAVPSGLVSVGMYTQDCVLGYSQPILSKLGF
jgi:hypothetical protein